MTTNNSGFGDDQGNDQGQQQKGGRAQRRSTSEDSNINEKGNNTSEMDEMEDDEFPEGSY